MSKKRTPSSTRSGSASRALRQRAEALLAKPGSEIPLISGEDIKAIIHELQVHQMELEIQNEELRAAQLELGEAHERYLDLYEFAPVGYLTLDSEGVILESNLTAVTILAIDRVKLIGAKLSDFVHRSSQDEFFLFRRKVFSSGVIQTCELEMHRADASFIDMRLEGLAVSKEAVESVSCRIALIDLREEKAAKVWEELALRMLQMVEHLPMGAVYVDSGIIKMNHAAEVITGYASDELTTLDQWFSKVVGHRRNARRHYEAMYEKGFPTCEIDILTRKDGEERTIEFAAHRFGSRAVWILQDITEREKAIDALRKSEERNRSVLNAAVDSIIAIDMKGTIVSVNPATEEMFGYTRKELVGQSVGVLMPSPFRDEHSGHLARYHETGETRIVGISREVIGQRKDGSTFPADLAVSAADSFGNCTGIVRDISLRKQSAEALKLEYQFSENLIETTQSIILVLDATGRIIRFNATLQRLTGWSLEEVEGRDWFDTFLPERDRNQVRQLFHRALNGQSAQGNVNPILTKAGKERQIEWRDAPFRESDGSLIGLIYSGVDVTESRHLEQQVYQAAEEERIRIAGDLHDGLGSLLTGISYLTSALSGKIRRGQEAEAGDIDVIVENIREAISQTRTLARGLHQIGDNPDALPIALNSLSKRVAETSGMVCRFINRNGAFTLHDATKANHLLRIAQEAVNNAIRHSGGTHLTIHLKKLEEGRHILSIKDNGCGFDQHETGQGNCLGLRTMAYRARAIGALLSIEPRRNQGTKVTCIFQSD